MSTPMLIISAPIVPIVTGATEFAGFIQANLVPGSSLTAFGVVRTEYCGPNFTGGKLFGDDLSIQPTGAVDAGCKSHDSRYADAQGQPNERQLELQADSELFNNMIEILRSFRHLCGSVVRYRACSARRMCDGQRGVVPAIAWADGALDGGTS